MERLPTELHLKIFSLLDYQNLTTAQQVCRKWKGLASDNMLWSKLVEERWGSDRTSICSPLDSSKNWKCIYEVEDRCDRFGVEPKIIREGVDYYLANQGQIQRHLGSKQPPNNTDSYSLEREFGEEEFMEDEPKMGIFDQILFFIGDLETTSSAAKRSRYA